MHTTDRASLLKSSTTASWKRRAGPCAVELFRNAAQERRGHPVETRADKFVEFVPSNETFGQVPRFYPRTVGVGAYKTFIPAEHLEVFDAAAANGCR